MAFVCKACKGEKLERERRYVGNDWCVDCVEAETRGESATTSSKVRRDLPAYMRRTR